MEEKKGWSWLGFLFPAFYYAGYGKLNKGLVFIVLSTFYPIGTIGAIVLAIYGGLKARQELPVGQIPFSWKNVAIVVVVGVAVTVGSSALMSALRF